MGLQTFDSRIFDVEGAIHEDTVTNERGQEILTDTILYASVRSQYMNPLKTDTLETTEFQQQVAKLKASWKIRNSTSRTIVANKMAYVVDGEYHMITGVRKFKGDRNLLVLDTILRDNQSTDLALPNAPTNLILSGETISAITATVTAPSNGQQTGYNWKISTDDVVFIIAGTTNASTPTFEFTSLLESTTYFIKAEADGDIPRETSSETTETLSAFQAESLLVFGFNPTLSAREKDSVDKYIVSEKAADNYTKFDDQGFTGLTTGDFKISFKGVTATVEGGLIQNGTGIKGNITNVAYLLNFNLEDDGVQFQKNDCSFQVFLKAFTTAGGVMFGCQDASFKKTRIKAGASSQDFAVNSIETSQTDTLEANKSYGITRSDDSTMQMRKNGVGLGTKAIAVGFTPVTNEPVLLAFNDGTIKNYTDMTESYWGISAESGVDWLAHETNIRIFIAENMEDAPVDGITAANLIINA